MLDWWIDLPSWLKYGVALLVLSVAAGAWFAGYFWPGGWGVGGVLLCAAMFIE